jgi:hypothetical protein
MMYIKGWVRIRGKLHTSNPFFEMEKSPKKIDLSPARSLAVREKNLLRLDPWLFVRPGGEHHRVGRGEISSRYHTAYIHSVQRNRRANFKISGIIDSHRTPHQGILWNSNDLAG